MIARRCLFIALIGLGLLKAPGVFVRGQEPTQAGEPARLGIASPHNQQMADAIADRLRQAKQIRHYQVDITFQDGAAELSGQVMDPIQRGEVLRIVQRVTGVEKVVDHLSVAGQTPLTRAQAVTEPPVFQPGPEPKPDAPAKGGMGPEPTPIFQAPPGPQPGMMPPRMPPYAWPTYAPYNNFSRVAYPNLYPYQSWPFIGPFYPYPKIPPGWRSITLSWMDGYWWYGKNATPHDWWRVRYW
ncbi:MAG TPA: BON domain-containing protein [Gemmataceae bacterium]|nr:BON domain-containing protein [Gemmataceae bacterium]